jgi:hypothetical protein
MDLDPLRCLTPGGPEVPLAPQTPSPRPQPPHPLFLLRVTQGDSFSVADKECPARSQSTAVQTEQIRPAGSHKGTKPKPWFSTQSAYGTEATNVQTESRGVLGADTRRNLKNGVAGAESTKMH